MSDEFGTRQKAEISILRKISHFRVYFSLALLICLLGLSCSLSLFLYTTMSPPLSPSFSRAQTLTRSDLARFSWDASLPWNRVVSGWLWTLFLSELSWVIDRLSNGLGTLSPCYATYCLWSYFHFIILLNLHTLTEKWYVEYLTKKPRMQIF